MLKRRTSKVAKNTFIAPNKVYKFDTSGNLVAMYHSAYAAAVANNMAHCQLSKAALNNKPFRNAFYRYTDMFDVADLALVINTRPIQIFNNSRGSKSKMLYSYDKHGKFVRSFRSPMDAKAFLGVNDISHISKALNGKRPIAFGYMWAKRLHSNLITYKQQQFNVVVKDTNGNLLWTAPSYAEAAAKLGVDLRTIYNAVDPTKNPSTLKQYKIEKYFLHKI